MRPEAEPRAHLVVRPLAAKDRGWAESLLVSLWGSSRIVSRGRVHDLMTLPGFVAEDRREPVGLATYRLEDAECELTSLDAVQEHQGAGTVLLEAVRHAAGQAGCRRLWLVTTNDNLEALRFYQRRGLHLAAVHRDAVERSRQIKPEIPAIGDFGIPLRDEIELEALLMPEAA